VFTPKRLAMLETLASQAAISLENASLYADLQQENIVRKRAEEELRRSEGFLAQGERIGHTGSWGWQVGTGLLYWSKEHFRIFDYDPETTTPSFSLFMERIHPEDRFSFEEILNRAVRDKRDFEYDYRIVLPDRSIKFLRSVGQALVNPSGELEFIGTVMDITDLKRAEEMRAALAKRTRHFADVSMRSPLCPNWMSFSARSWLRSRGSWVRPLLHCGCVISSKTHCRWSSSSKTAESCLRMK
jgi:hypothetical protein